MLEGMREEHEKCKVTANRMREGNDCEVCVCVCVCFGVSHAQMDAA